MRKGYTLTHTHKKEEELPQDSAKKNRDEEKRKEYASLHFRLQWGETIAKLFLLLLFLFSGLSLELRQFSEETAGGYYGTIITYMLILTIATELLFFPLEYYSGYVVEHRYELSNQSLPRFLTEQLKGFTVGLVLNALLLLLLYAFLHTMGDNWWLAGAAVFFLLMVLMAHLAPLVLFPLFYTFTPLEDAKLLERLRALAERYNVHVNAVFSMDMSKNTKKANAAFTGIGNSKRILLSDTLLENFTPDEIEAVLAHELGHRKGNHLWKLMGVQGLTLFALFGLSNSVMHATWQSFGFRGIDDIAALPLLLLTFSLVSLLLLPVMNGISRRFEKEADTFALEATGSADAFIGAMQRLAELNLAETEPPRWKEFLFHSHPSIASRIQMAENFRRQKSGQAAV